MILLDYPVMRMDGKKARILCTDLKGENCVVAAIQTDTVEVPHTFKKSGQWSFSEGYTTRFDLVNVFEVMASLEWFLLSLRIPNEPPAA